MTDVQRKNAVDPATVKGSLRDRGAPFLSDPRSQPIVSLEGYRTAARTVLPKDIFDYIDGGAGDEVTLRANRRDLDAIELRPLVFRDVTKVDPTWSGSLGDFTFPLGLSPTAMHRLVHPDGEIATANAARNANIPMIASMMASFTIEEIAERSGHEALWLQTYFLKDRALGMELVQRAERAGYKAIVVSAGCPVIGKRDRNLLNGFRLPADVGAANFRRNSQIDHNNPIHSFDAAELDMSATWKSLEQISASTALPVIVKGIANPVDIRPALDAGVSGILVSNHGGRQLDGTASSISILRDIAELVSGRVPLLLDGGIRRGTDILKALASGADAAFIGSSTLWALTVEGQAGVSAALDILLDEFLNALRLVGCKSIDDLRQNASAIIR